MSLRDRDVLFRSTLAATFSIATAMLAVLLIGLWGAQRELSDVRAALLRSEISRLRSHGIRTVARLEGELERQGPEAQLESLPGTSWLERFWSQVIPRERQRLYAAVINSSGVVVMHSDETLIGQQLSDDWKTGDVPLESGFGGVFQTRSPALSGGLPAFDIVIPIEVRGQPVGSYHSGFGQSWFDEVVAVRQRSVRNRWIVIIGSILAVILLAGVSLHRINRRSAALQQAISMAQVKQYTDLGRLVGALAHEIRNPLNAIRLNLHVLRNVLLGTASLSDEEIEQVVEESNREIERLSALMKTMLGYARPDQAVVEQVELNAEMDAISSFLAPVMDRDGVDLVLALPDQPVTVAIDPDRLRQILLNLLNNAREAAGAGGRVRFTLTSTGDRAEVTVEDNGPGVPASDRDRIFDAFYSTRETGTGLGLALVKRFVEEAGGSVQCDDHLAAGRSSGALFRVVFPIVSATGATPCENQSARAEAAGVA